MTIIVQEIALLYWSKTDVSFRNKFADCSLVNLSRTTATQVFFCDFWKNFDSFLTEQLWSADIKHRNLADKIMAASDLLN